MKKFSDYLEMIQNEPEPEVEWTKKEIAMNQLAGPLQYEVEKLSLDEEKPQIYTAIIHKKRNLLVISVMN